MLKDTTQCLQCGLNQGPLDLKLEPCQILEQDTLSSACHCFNSVNTFLQVLKLDKNWR